MDSRPTPNKLLAHFDRPKTLELPDFEWVDEVIPFDSASRISDDAGAPKYAAERFIEVPRDMRRGILWVLAWAGALVVFVIAAGVLTQFTYVLAAERALSVAARAGAMEATLPRATYQSVTAVVNHRLNQYPQLAKQLRLSLLQNGIPVQSHFRQHEGDHFAISLSGPGSSAIPNWLRTLMRWNDAPSIQASADQQIPGRKLVYEASHATQPR